MPQVNTVLGPVDGGGLGSTLMHEHIFVLSPEMEKTADEWDEEVERGRAVARLRDLKGHGIDTLVDLTVIGLGRSIPRVAAIAGAGARSQRGRGLGRLHLQRGPDVLPFPGAGHGAGRRGADGRPLRPGGPRGHR